MLKGLKANSIDCISAILQQRKQQPLLIKIHH